MNKEKKKIYSLPKQIFSLLQMHLICNVFLLIFGSILFTVVEKYFILKLILSIILVIIYGLSIFNSAYSCAMSDHKSYTPLKPYPIKGAVLSLAILVFNILCLAYYNLAWKLWPINDTFIVQTFISNIFFLLSNFAFNGFIDMQGGNFNYIGVIFSELLPIIFCIAGYYCGYIKFDYTKYINFLVYDKKKKNN